MNNSINSKNDSIIVNPPKPEMSLPKQSDSSQINYHLDNLKQKINCESGDTIHICIFTIQKETNKARN